MTQSGQNIVIPVVRYRKFMAALAFIFPTLTIAAGWTLRPDGAGPVKIGMTLRELNHALRENLKLPEFQASPGCFTVESKKHPEFLFMIINDKVVRIDLRGTEASTNTGIKLGQSVDKLLTAYKGHLDSEQNFYDSEERNYTYFTSGKKFATRFETGKDEIRLIYGGTWEAVQFVEGCD